MDRFNGVLVGYFETGTEGVVWALERSGYTGYDSLVILQEGDQISIRNYEGETVYEGIVQPDDQSHLELRPNSALRQPTSNGRWVHWTQFGVDPDVWGSWFLYNEFAGSIVRPHPKT